MNEFGVPMGNAEISMHSNPAKAMMQEQLATAGMESNIVGTLIGAAVSIGGAIIGGNKAASAAKEETNARNAQTEIQYQYDTELWEMARDRIIEDRYHAAQEIAQKAENEQAVAEYRDATSLANYGYQLQIRNREQRSLDSQYLKSSQIYGLQTTLNADTARDARENELVKLQEIKAEAAFDLQEQRVEQMQAEGKARARGVTGRSAGKVEQASAADLGRQMAMLSESMESADRNTKAVLKQIQREKVSSDLSAYANRMLEPGTLPEVIAPFQTPVAEWLMPRELLEADFGPRPIKGAMASASAASNRVWGSTITGIAGTAGSLASDLYKGFKTGNWE